jgi:hypothetical protein
MHGGRIAGEKLGQHVVSWRLAVRIALAGELRLAAGLELGPVVGVCSVSIGEGGPGVNRRMQLRHIASAA